MDAAGAHLISTRFCSVLVCAVSLCASCAVRAVLCALCCARCAGTAGLSWAGLCCAVQSGLCLGPLSGPCVCVCVLCVCVCCARFLCARAPLCALSLSVRAPGLHTTAREPKRAHFRAPALQTPPKFHGKTPKREKKERKLRREMEKSAKCWALHTSGPHPSGLHPSGLTFRSQSYAGPPTFSGLAPTFSSSGPPP